MREGSQVKYWRPEDPGYDDARKVHNGLVDKRPALIARCRGTTDVVDAVRFASTHGLEIAVRGGGHNVAGRATVEGGVMIDLALMKGIHVDPRERASCRCDCILPPRLGRSAGWIGRGMPDRPDRNAHRN